MSNTIDIQLIENIILLAKKHQVQLLELEVQDWRVRVGTENHPSSHAIKASAPVYNTSSSISANSAHSEVQENHASNASFSQTEQATSTTITTPVHTIVSPMIGTFYRKSNPEMPALVEIGQRVEVGDVLCIVEAMKIMYEVKAEQAGIVQAILLEDGAMVEYGQALFELSQV